MANLLPKAANSTTRIGPSLIHGDFLMQNVVIATDCVTSKQSSSSNGPRLALLDFADAGHGDRMLDIVHLLAGCLKLDPTLSKEAWLAYRSVVVGNTTLCYGEYPLSYIAMCYCLLHEEDLVIQEAFRNNKSVLKVAREGGLKGIQQFLWDFLDE